MSGEQLDNFNHIEKIEFKSIEKDIPLTQVEDNQQQEAGQQEESYFEYESGSFDKLLEGTEDIDGGQMDGRF